MTTTAMVPLASIKCEDRFRKDLGDLMSLVENIRQFGLIQPLAVVEETDGTTDYTLLAGGRRFAACQAIPLENVPVRVYDNNLSELEQRSIELCENIYRKDMTWQEETLLKQEIHRLQVALHGEKISTSPQASGWSQSMTASLLGESKQNLSRDLQLASLVDLIPAIGACTNKNDAEKLIKKLGRDVIAQQVAAQLNDQRAATPLDLQRKLLCSRFIVRDFFEFVREQPADHYHVIEIDPPYGIDLVGLRENNSFVGAAQEYTEVSQDTYAEFIQRVVKESARVLHPDGWLLLWYAVHPHSEVVNAALRDNGFSLTMPGAWVKPTGQTNNPNYMLGSQMELFQYCRKSPGAIIRRPGRGNLFEYPRVPDSRRFHPAERPIEMIEDLLSTFGKPGDRVLVPFLGSGNTLLAASNLGMDPVGTDLSQDYKNHFQVRVFELAPGQYYSLCPKLVQTGSQS